VTTRMPNQCQACERFRRASATCEAFPGGIPKEMLYYGGDHREPLPGDHGLQFVQGTETEQLQAYQDWRATFDVA
jgi:hypothetical protein